MKLKQYLAQLNQLANDYPKALEFDVVTSKDDEGNGYDLVHYSPCIGKFEDNGFDNELPNGTKPNSVCLN